MHTDLCQFLHLDPTHPSLPPGCGRHPCNVVHWSGWRRGRLGGWRRGSAHFGFGLGDRLGRRVALLLRALELPGLPGSGMGVPMVLPASPAAGVFVIVVDLWVLVFAADHMKSCRPWSHGGDRGIVAVCVGIFAVVVVLLVGLLLLLQRAVAPEAVVLLANFHPPTPVFLPGLLLVPIPMIPVLLSGMSLLCRLSLPRQRGVVSV